MASARRPLCRNPVYFRSILQNDAVISTPHWFTLSRCFGVTVMLDVLIVLYVLMSVLCIVGAMMFLSQNKRCGVWMTPVAVLSGIAWPVGVVGHFYNKRAARLFQTQCVSARVEGWHRYRYVVMTPEGQVRPLVNDQVPAQEIGGS